MPKLGSFGTLYCVACKSKKGDVVDGKPVQLFCFPSGKSEDQQQRRKAWISKVKTVRRDTFPLNKNTRLCSLHFVNCDAKAKDSVPDHMVLSRSTPNAKQPRQTKTSRGADCPSTSNASENAYVPNVLDHIPEEEIADIRPTVGEATHVPDLPEEVPQDKDVSAREEQEIPVFQTIANKNIVAVSTETQAGSSFAFEDKAVQVDLPDIAIEDFQTAKDDDAKVRFYTGLPNLAVFMLMFSQFVAHGAEKMRYWYGEKRSGAPPADLQKRGKERKLRTVDEFLMVLMKIRLGLLQEHLADIFKVSSSTVSRVVITWINFMANHCKGMIPWVTREQILTNLPKSFSDMDNVRIVIDCTEIFIEKPSSLEAQSQTWSEYKHHNTVKLCIGCAPNGLITFVSRLWGGKASDRHIVSQDGSQFIPYLEEGDVVLADKGFLISDLLPSNVGLNMPPFVKRNQQMSEEEFFKTREIAGPRIVIEMVNEQIKNFRILQGIYPLSQIHILEQTVLLCCALTNLYDPILK